jgi:hypothetical protein
MGKTNRRQSLEQIRKADRRRKRVERADVRERKAPTTAQLYSAVTEALAFTMHSCVLEPDGPVVPLNDIFRTAREILTVRHRCDVKEANLALFRALSNRPAFNRPGHVPSHRSAKPLPK